MSLGRPDRHGGEPLNPNVVMSSTYHQGGAAVYGRDANATWEALEAAVGGLEGGDSLAFASGLAAISAVIEMLPVPGRVVVAADAYNGTRRLLGDLAGRGRLRYRSVPVDDLSATIAVCSEVAETPSRPAGARPDFAAGGLLWIESPTNPLMAVADIAGLTAAAHDLGMDVVVDNTFATPLLQRPLDLGADVVVHSASKFLSGHSDVVLGMAVTRRSDVLTGLVQRRSLHGGIPGPWESWLVLRGIRTLHVRLERAQSNAGVLAERLAAHPRVVKVRYPGLPDDPGHEIAQVQMTGFGAMLSFEVEGGEAAAEAVAESVRLATAATSLGGVETLIERRGRWAGEETLPPGLLRLSVGIEDVDDLWADLAGAIDLAHRPPRQA